MFIFKRDGFYHLQYTDDKSGKTRRISTKAKSKTDALKFLTDFQQKLIVRKQTRRKKVSLTKFKDEYINHIQLSKSPSYIKSVKLSFRMLQKFCKEINISEVDYRTADKFVSQTFARSNYAAGLYYRTLKAAFSKAVAWEYINLNPWTKVTMPRLPANIPVFMNQDEMNTIISYTEKESMRRIFSFAFQTGMRLSEILNLQWSDVNIDDSFIKIANTKTFKSKSKKERFVPINSCSCEILLKQQNDGCGEYVFSVNGLRYMADHISKQFKKAVRASGVNDRIRFHSIRHSFASNLVRRGVSLYTIKELLGHENISTTQIYSHLQKQDLLDAIKLLE